MANLTADSKVNWQGLGPRQSKSYIVGNAVQLYVGSIVKLSGGYLAKKTAGALIVALGVVIGPGVPGNNLYLDGYTLTTLPVPSLPPGNVSTAAAGNANRAIVELGAFTWQQVTLTLANGTLSGLATDVGTKVYATSDNVADLTDTQTSTDHPFGILSAFYSATATAAVYDVFVDSYDARSRGN